MKIKETLRETKQEVMPQQVRETEEMERKYNLYPSYVLQENKIQCGYESLADWMSLHEVVKIDGYVGVCWTVVVERLTKLFEEKGLRVKWVFTQDFIKERSAIDALIEPFLGERDAVWGKNTTLTLSDFFDNESFREIEIDTNYDLNVIVGVGAALVEYYAPVVYLDLPKNELLYRMRAKAITNLGNNQPQDKASMYKRFYFVDWVVLNKH